jgi:hypothetical protein
MFADGKRTAAEISELLASHGAGGPDVLTLEKIFEFLAQRGLARLRKYVTQAEVRNALAEAGLVTGDLVLGDFSLSQFGYIEGGAEGVIDTLVELLGPVGTLIMPAFTFSFVGNAPYDPDHSASRAGAVTDYFWRGPGVLRSAHPSHSFAAVGNLASYLLEGHDHTKSPFSKDGPIGKLADLDAKILMFCNVGRKAEREELRAKGQEQGPKSRDAGKDVCAPDLYAPCLALQICMQAGQHWSGTPFPDLVCRIWEGEAPREVIVPNCPWHPVSHRAYERLYAGNLLRDIPLGESAIHTMRCRDAIGVLTEAAE